MLETSLQNECGVVKVDPSTLVRHVPDNEEPVSAHEVGVVYLVLTLRPSGEGLFLPALYLVGKNGFGNIKEFQPLKVSGIPNFERAVKSAMDLSIKVTESANQRELPKGMLVVADRDCYILHIGAMKVSRNQLDSIIKIIQNDQQQASDSSTGEAAPC